MYKQANGSQLEADFNDLMTYMQFTFAGKSGDEGIRREAMRKVEIFRAKIKRQ